MAIVQAEQFLRPIDSPSVEMLEGYRDMMIDTVRTLRKGIKLTPRFPGAEFMLPGSHTEWSSPDDQGNVNIIRDRTYMASYRQFGESARKLVVLESDSVRIPSVGNVEEDSFSTQRRIFRFGWADDEVYDSQGFFIEIISKAVPKMTVEKAGQKVLALAELEESNDPFRFEEHVLVSGADFEGLMYRTEGYRQAYLISDAIDDGLAS